MQVYQTEAVVTCGNNYGARGREYKDKLHCMRGLMKQEKGSMQEGQIAQ